jgi:hypothetical protein
LSICESVSGEEEGGGLNPGGDVDVLRGGEVGHERRLLGARGDVGHLVDGELRAACEPSAGVGHGELGEERDDAGEEGEDEEEGDFRNSGLVEEEEEEKDEVAEKKTIEKVVKKTRAKKNKTATIFELDVKNCTDLVSDEKTGKVNMDINWSFNQGDLVKVRM